MKVYSLICLITLTLFSQTIVADVGNKDNSGFSAQLRFGLTQTEEGEGKSDKTTAIGGSLGYLSPSKKGLSVGGKVYSTNPIGDDEEGSFLASDGEGYTILGEAWAQVIVSDTTIKVGRQIIDTPFANANDVGMIPNTFQGVFVSNSSFANTTLIATHLDKWAGIDADIPEKLTDLNGTKGVNALGLVYEKDQWSGQVWHYDQKNSTDISYLELALSPIDKLDLGLQFTMQKDNAIGGKGSAWGVTASYTLGELVVSADYNQSSGSKGVINGFCGGPYFTSAEGNTIEGVAGIRANAIGVEYSGINHLTLAVLNVDFNKGVGNELDMTASYEIRDNLTADLIISDMGIDGKNNRFFINYDVDF